MAAQGLSVFSITPTSSAPNQPFRKPFDHIMSFCLSSSFVGTKVSIQPSSFSLVASKRRSYAVATISFSLPTTKTEGLASDKKPLWSARSIKSFAMAELEARKLKYPNTGTEALLMGILVEGTSLAAKYLRENGITLFKVRDETVKLLGKSDMYFFSPEHPPLTEPAQKALDWAVEEKLKSVFLLGMGDSFLVKQAIDMAALSDSAISSMSESGEITTAHLLLGIWSQKECAGYKILSALGFDDDKANELAKNMDKDIILSFK